MHRPSVLHFILFVAACIDTHHRRNWWKKQILLKTTEKGIADESAVHLVGSAAMAPPMPYDGGYSAFPAPSGNTRAAATPGPAASH